MGRYKRTCTSGATSVSDFLLKAVAFTGGMNTQHPAKAPATSTWQPLLKGETFATGKDKAYTWPDGMTVNGVKISMQTGYDSSAQVSYKSGASRRICGTSSHGPASSPLIVVKP